MSIMVVMVLVRITCFLYKTHQFCEFGNIKSEGESQPFSNHIETES